MTAEWSERCSECGHDFHPDDPKYYGPGICICEECYTERVNTLTYKEDYQI